MNADSLEIMKELASILEEGSRDISSTAEIFFTEKELESKRRSGGKWSNKFMESLKLLKEAQKDV